MFPRPSTRFLSIATQRKIRFVSNLTNKMSLSNMQHPQEKPNRKQTRRVSVSLSVCTARYLAPLHSVAFHAHLAVANWYTLTSKKVELSLSTPRRHAGEVKVQLRSLNLQTRCSRVVNFTSRPLYPRERTTVTNEWEAGCAPEPVWKVWRRQPFIYSSTPLAHSQPFIYYIRIIQNKFKRYASC